MRRGLRWFLALVLVTDAAIALTLMLGGLSSRGIAADKPVDKPAAADAAPAPPSPETLKKLGEQLALRSAELDRKQAEVDEAIRGSEVLKRAGLAPEATPSDKPAEVKAAKKTGSKKEKAPADPFTQLQRAYENMEPDSAAKALIQLADLDKQAVVKMIVGWKPRTSGAILDALTQIKPGLAADLSYEIWRQGGNAGAEAADSDR